MWTQVYDPVGGALFSALLAGIPLIALFYMLAVRRSKGHHAALVAVVLSAALAVGVWGMPLGIAVNSFLYGAAFGLFPIIWIVVTAVWVYNMTVESGEFEHLKQSLASLTDDRRLQAIFIAFAFGAFLEGTAGFGTPVAITAAMLVGLGFKPLYAAGVCLIANTAPVAFGAIGVPIIVAGQVSGFSDMTISAIVGRQLPFMSVIVPLWLCVLMCGFKRSMEVLPAIAVAGVCFAGSQFLFSNFHGPTLPDIMSALITIIGLVILLRVWKPANVWRFEGEDSAASALEKAGPINMGVVLRAWSPYIILAVMVFLWGLPQFKNLLNAIPGSVITFGWPGLDGMVVKTAPIAADSVYGAKFTFNWLSAGGTAILLAGLFSVPLMPGYSFGKAVSCFGRTVVQLRFPIVTIAMILGLAYLMNYSGTVLRHAAQHCGSGGHVSRTGRGRQLLRRRHRQDDFAPVHQRGHCGHQYGGAGRRSLPFRSAAQSGHDRVHLRADLAAGWPPALDAALTPGSLRCPLSRRRCGFSWIANATQVS